MTRKQERGRVALALVAASFIALSTFGTGSSFAAPPTQDELEAAEDRLHELEADFEIVVERYNLVSERLIQLQSRISEARANIGELEKSMAASEDQAVDVATELYKSGGPTESLEAVLGSDSLSEIDARMTYLESTDETNSKVFEELANQGQTVIMVTHEQDIAAHARRVIVLRDGVIATDDRGEAFAAKAGL